MPETFRLTTIILPSLAVTWFFVEAGGYIVPGGAAMFFAWARDLTGMMPPDYAQRDVGWPLLIWLSGYPWTGSVRGVVGLHAAMAVAMPVMVYWTVRPFSLWGGWLAAMLTVASLGPWLYMKFLYPDQAGVFFSALSLMLLSLYLARGHVGWLYGFTVAAMFLSITRPALNAVFPCLMLVALVFQRQQRG